MVQSALLLAGCRIGWPLVDWVRGSGRPRVIVSHSARCGMRFAVRAQPPTAVIKGPETITSRVRFVAQPDSPVAITRVDFSDANLMVAGEWFVFDKGYEVEVIWRERLRHRICLRLARAAWRARRRHRQFRSAARHGAPSAA
jgi:hypothetical protein